MKHHTAMERFESALDNLKDIPGFKAILRTVLKCQMQYLVEQMSKHVDEETIILTASVSDGSLNHQGSDTARGFLQGREEISSQFLGYCLKNHHKQLASGDASMLTDAHDTCTSIHHKQSKRKLRHSPTSTPPLLPATSASQQHVHAISPNNISTNSKKHKKICFPEELTNVNAQSMSMSPTLISDESESPYASNSHNDTDNSQSWTGEGTKKENQSYETMADAAGDTSYTIIKPEPSDESNGALETAEDSGNRPDGETFPGFAGPNQGHMGTGFTPLNDQGSFTEEEQLYLSNISSASSQSTAARFQCKKCGKYFKNLQNMKVHDRQHTGVRPYACELCDKRFFQKSHLKSHLAMHTQELQFTCSVCGESFRWKSSLVSHKISNKHYEHYQPQAHDT